MDKEKILIELKEVINSKSSQQLEKLSAAFIELATGIKTLTASSGRQEGADGGAYSSKSIIRIEAKRYKDTTSLNKRDLLGEISESEIHDQDVDAWVLITTRDVPEQTYKALVKHGLKFGLPIIFIDWSEHNPTLAKLCASCPQIVGEVLGDEAAQLATFLSEFYNENDVLENLNSELLGWSTGWELTRGYCDDYFSKLLLDKSLGIRDFKQKLNISSSEEILVQRNLITNKVKQFIASGDNPLLIVAGKEGTGKTWVVTDALNNINNQSSVSIICSAHELSSQKINNLNSLLSEILYKRTNIKDSEYWSKRVNRYSESYYESQNKILLVIDGINENKHIDWVAVLNEAFSNRWNSFLKVVVTSRTKYAFEQLGANAWPDKPKSIIVEDFTKSELTDYLHRGGVDTSALQDKVSQAAQNPRVARLLLTILKKSTDVSSITYEQLMFDFGRRFIGDKFDEGNNEKAWKKFLYDLTSEFKTKSQSSAISYSLVEKSIRSFGSNNTEIAIDNILESKLFHENEYIPGNYEFDSQIISIAHGFALWYRLAKLECISNIEEIRNLIGSILEPIDGMDDRVEIISAAIVSAYLYYQEEEEDSLNIIVPALILEAANSQNVSSNIEDMIFSYTKPLVEPFLISLQILSIEGQRTWPELIFSSIKYNQTKDNEDIILKYVTSWLCIINTNHAHESKQESQLRRQESKIKRWLNNVDYSKPVSILGCNFCFLDRIGNLFSYGLSFLQNCKSIPETVWKLIGISLLFSSHDDESTARWLLRLPRDTIVSDVKNVRDLAETILDSEVEGNINKSLRERVAFNLYKLSSIDQDELRAKSILPYPDNWDVFKDDLENPVHSIYTAEYSNVQSILESTKQPIHITLMRLRAELSDPIIVIPENRVEEALLYLNNIDFQELHSSRSSKREDSIFEDVSLLLAAGKQKALSRCYHKFLGELKSRTGTPWCQAAIHLSHLCILISRSNFNKHIKPELNRDINHSDKDMEEYSRSVLISLACNILTGEQYAKLVLLSELNVIGQLFVSSLYNQKLNNKSLVKLLNILNSLEPNKRKKKLWLFLNIIYYSGVDYSEEILSEILAATESNESGIRRLAFVILEDNLSPLVLVFLKKENFKWSDFKDKTIQNSVSLMYLNFINEFDKEMIPTYIAPWHYLKALTKMKRCDRLLSAFVLLLSSEIIKDVPNLKFRVVRNRTPSMNFNHIKPIYPQHNLFNETEEDYLSRIASSEKELFDYISRMTNGGKPLYDRTFCFEDVHFLVNNHANVIPKILIDLDSGASQLKEVTKFNYGFYLSLCEVLLISQPGVGKNLWNVLKQTNSSITFKDEYNYDCLLSLPFKVDSDNACIRELRDHFWTVEYLNDDMKIFEFVTMVESYGRIDWLDEKIKNFRESKFKLHNDISVLSQASLSDPDVDESILRSYEMQRIQSSYVKKKSSMIAYRAKQQKHWLSQILFSKCDNTAFSSYILLLNTCDIRWRLILNNLVSTKESSNISRIRFLNMHASELDKKAVKFSNKLSKKFIFCNKSPNLNPWLYSKFDG